MYAFTKPQPKKEDLSNWKAHFASKGIYSEIIPSKDGFVLYVDSPYKEVPPEKPYYEPKYDPPRGPCIYCGGTEHIENYNSFNPHFMFCSDSCRELYKRRLEREKE